MKYVFVALLIVQLYTLHACEETSMGVFAAAFPPGFRTAEQPEITVHNNQPIEGWNSESLGILVKILNVHGYSTGNPAQLAQDLVSFKKKSANDPLTALLVQDYEYSTDDLTNLENDLFFLKTLKTQGCNTDPFAVLAAEKLRLLPIILNDCLKKEQQNLAVMFYYSEKTGALEYNFLNKYLAERMAHVAKHALPDSKTTTAFADLLLTATLHLDLLEYVKLRLQQPYTIDQLCLLDQIIANDSCIVHKQPDGTFRISKDRWHILQQSIQKMNFRMTLLKISAALMLFSFLPYRSFLPINNWGKVRMGIVLYWVYMGWYGGSRIFR